MYAGVGVEFEDLGLLGAEAEERTARPAGSTMASRPLALTASRTCAATAGRGR